ncbi:helix-turn-helix domain-containing protein [Kitasatospora sp. NPDC002551]|uniref:helix-turn-helix domain-containing protein n=1 Tax=unclassified Kitasatospora TaxID=2633591 RepID=UPI003333B7BE
MGTPVRSRPHRTLTSSQGVSIRPRSGVVSGYVLRVIREQHGLTQEGFAEKIGVSADTIAGWESGRRPLTAVPFGQMLATRHRLMQLGTTPALLHAFEHALEADVLLASVLEDAVSETASPLGSMVMQRDLIELLAWPLSGLAPRGIRKLPAPARARRGPAPAGPDLSASERARFFANMRRTAEEARGSDQFLLRRQALYLAGLDDQDDTSSWLAHQQRTQRPTDWLSNWLNLRSAAMVSARHGDQDRLTYFIDTALADDAGATANLNYWAYWIGELPLELSDDFIPDSTPAHWSGHKLLTHLTEGLNTDHGYLDLNIHTVWSLLKVRPNLLRLGVATTALRERLAMMLDSPEVSARGRRELESIRYAIRLAEV